MASAPLRFDDVSFTYDTAWLPVFRGLSAEFPAGFTGVIGPNGSGKTTLLRLAAGEIAPTAGALISPGAAVHCPQRTDAPPPGFDAFLVAPDRRAAALAGRLGIGADWDRRWPTLSHGERKRGQIASALWRDPAVLLLDEPTNHVDLDARRMLAGALRAFRGVGLLVAHDRELLDSLCDRCLFLEPGGPVMRPGGYTKAVELARADREAVRKAREDVERDRKRIARESGSRRRDAEAAQRRRSKRGIDPKDHDAKFRINRARVSAKDAKAGARYRQLDGRLRQVEERLEGLAVGKERRLGLTMRGERARRAYLLRVPAGEIDLHGGRRLRHPALEVAPDSRIAVTGPNGAGKTTLVESLLARLDLPEERVLSVPQEIDAARGAGIADAVRALPRARRGAVLSVVSRLGSDPERVLETPAPSPGEVRKLSLALGLSRSPWLVAMDEPTNHLDLPSIECLEAALTDCRAALVLVSHDERFLAALTRTRWEVCGDGEVRVGGAGSPPR